MFESVDPGQDYAGLHTVLDAGTIKLPGAKEVEVAGLTVHEIGDRVAAALEEASRIRNPLVRVERRTDEAPVLFGSA